ncbi:MAG: urea transporter permease, partial [Enterobacter kobei]|nr:urea transporter permease [Enterobacter kobei]
MMKILPALGCLLLSGLLMAIPAHAGPAADYGKASRAQQIQLLQQWAAAPDASRLAFLQTLNEAEVVTDTRGQLFTPAGDKLIPLEGEAAPVGNVKKIFLNNRSPDASVRLQAALTLQASAQADQLPLLSARLAAEQDARVHTALAIAVANLQLADSRAEKRLEAVTLLGEASDPQVQASLMRLTQPQAEPD